MGKSDSLLFIVFIIMISSTWGFAFSIQPNQSKTQSIGLNGSLEINEEIFHGEITMIRAYNLDIGGSYMITFSDEEIQSIYFTTSDKEFHTNFIAYFRPLSDGILGIILNGYNESSQSLTRITKQYSLIHREVGIPSMEPLIGIAVWILITMLITAIVISFRTNSNSEKIESKPLDECPSCFWQVEPNENYCFKCGEELPERENPIGEI